MPTLPAVMVTLLLPFEHPFDPRTWRKAQLLAVGAPGGGSDPVSRTSAPCPPPINILGIGQASWGSISTATSAVYHQVLNRARKVADCN